MFEIFEIISMTILIGYVLTSKRGGSILLFEELLVNIICVFTVLIIANY